MLRNLVFGGLLLAISPSLAAMPKATDILIERQTGSVRVVFYEPDVVRIISAPEASQLPDEDLAIVDTPMPASEIEVLTDPSNPDSTMVRSSRLTVTVDAASTVSITDNDGSEIWSEVPGGRSFSPVDDQGTPAFRIGQRFTRGDYAIYGLGQHQDGILEIGNTPMRLEQFNQVIAIPFAVTTSGVGILWNNYSITDINVSLEVIDTPELVDEVANTRRGLYTAAESGIHSFQVHAPWPDRNRQYGPVSLTLNGEPVLHYDTMWVPNSLSGELRLEAGRRYVVELTDTTNIVPAKITVNRPSRSEFAISSEVGDAVDYFIMAGDSPADAIRLYRHVTGRAPMAPSWSLGFWHSRATFPDAEGLLRAAKTYREKKIPLDLIVQDFRYWDEEDGWGPTWDPERFPNPAAIIAKLNDLNLKTLVSAWPRVQDPKLVESYELEALLLPPYNLINAYHPRGPEAYFRMVDDGLLSKGVDSLWIDAVEPEYVPIETRTPMGSFRRFANIYSFLINREVYSAQREKYAGKRIFNMTRSAFLGQQRFGVSSWSGDVKASWEQLREQVVAGLQFSMSGIPYWGTDVGGFFRDTPADATEFEDQHTDPEYRELLIRWLQFGAFTPVFRVHGWESETELWRYGEQVESIARDTINLRYSLFHYNYALARDVTANHSTMMWPLAALFPNDPQSRRIDNQFFWGERIMVSPVMVHGQRSRSVYLPPGKWFDFFTEDLVVGGQRIDTAAPLDRIPLHVRAGTILPLGPAVQHTKAAFGQPLDLVVYPGADGQFTLYEDDGESLAFERGIFRQVAITYSDDSKTLRFGAAEGKMAPDEKRRFNVRLAGAPHSSLELVYSGEPVSVKLD